MSENFSFIPFVRSNITAGSYCNLAISPNIAAGSYCSLAIGPNIAAGSYCSLAIGPNISAGAYCSLAISPNIFAGAIAALQWAQTFLLWIVSCFYRMFYLGYTRRMYNTPCCPDLN